MEKRLVKIAGALLDMKLSEAGIREEMPGGTRYEVSQAVVNAVNDYLTDHSARSAGEALQALGRHTGMSTENIRCFASPEAAITMIARTYLEHGTEVVVNSPVDDGVLETAAMGSGAEVVHVEHDDPFDPRIETVINHVGPRTRMVFIANPNSVTGATFSESEIVFLLAYAESTMVVIDERQIEQGGRTVADLVKRFPNLTVIRSIGEMFGMGSLCMGYALGDAESLQFLDRIAIADSNSHMIYRAAGAALGDPSCLELNRVAIERSRALFARHLPELGYVFQAPQTDFLLLRVANIDFGMRLLSDSGFHAENLGKFTHLENYIKIGIGNPESTEMLLLELSLAAGHLATGYNRNRVIENSEIPVNSRIRQEIKLGQVNG